MGNELRGQVVAITGGARGIGLATAAAVSVAGAQVAIGDIDGDLAVACAKRIGAVGLPLDVRNEDSFGSFLAQTRQTLGPIDVLVNSAGVILVGDFVGGSALEHGVQLAVNLGGVVTGMRLALPSMLDRGTGRIVNVSSASGRIASPRTAIYSATKHAVLALTEAIGPELRGTGVHVVAVLPTFTDTEMAAGLVTQGIPKVSPDRVAAVVVRLLRTSHPPPSVMIPGWLRTLAVIDAMAPWRLRNAARRLFVVRVSGTSACRTGYERRVARQIDVESRDQGKES